MNELDEVVGTRTDVPPMSARAYVRGRQRLDAAMGGDGDWAASAARPGRWWPRRRVAVALATSVLGLAGVLALTAVAGTAPPAGGGRPVHVDVAAFTVDSQPDGTVVVTLRSIYDLFDPAALQKALADAGVRAVVKVGGCHWQNVSDHRAVQLEPEHDFRPLEHPRLLITPSAVPHGTEIVFDVLPKVRLEGKREPYDPRSETGRPSPTVQQPDGNGGVDVVELAGGSAGGGEAIVSPLVWGLKPTGSAITC
jgi:hypothetical protein